MANKRDYYEVLNVDRKASITDIKRAFRRLAKKFHPDVASTNDNAKYNDKKFKEINEAYEVLGDKNKRSAYDMFGHSAGAEQSTFNQRHHSGGFGNFNFDDLFGSFNTGFSFEDIFSNFGSQRKQQQESYGGNAPSEIKTYNLDLDFYILFHGKKLDLQLAIQMKCDKCAGSGALSQKYLMLCRQCAGRGIIVQQVGGFFQTQIKCPVCRGRGKKIIRPCTKCRGNGIIDNKINAVIDIPAGILPGLVIQKNIDPSRNIVARFVVNYTRSNIFSIDQQQNLIAQVTVHFIKALTGGVISVPNPHNGSFIEITIPANSANGTIFTVENVNGIPIKSRDLFGHGYQKYGKYYIRIIIEYPMFKQLTRDERLLLRQARKIGAKDIQDKYRALFQQEYTDEKN